MKINKKGFVLAETLVVTVFVMTIFTIIYANFYPIYGKYQEREYFDDIDSTYNVYWLKRFFEDPHVVNGLSWYIIKKHIETLGAYEFTCNKATTAGCPLIRDTQARNLVVGYSIATNPEHIYITKYNLTATKHTNGEALSDGKKQFKSDDKNDHTTYLYNYSNKTTADNYNAANHAINFSGYSGTAPTDAYRKYYRVAYIEPRTKRYLDYLPQYKFPSTRGARYRIIAEYNKSEDISDSNKDQIYTYATIEMKRS